MKSPPGKALARSARGAMDEASDAAVTAFPIAGIGASAGGLVAFEQFSARARRTPAWLSYWSRIRTRSTRVCWQNILQRTPAMPVMQALDQTRVERDRIYVIPPNREMGILNRALQISRPEPARAHRMPIDAFLRSLAEDHAENAIGIVFSGTTSDGTLGLRAILGGGGICMVQEPSTAQYDGMPHSAIAAGCATHILPVEQMPAMLQAVARQSAFRQKVPAVATEKTLTGMNQILLQLRTNTGHDFSLYKKSTIVRRIERRMARHNIESAAVYVRYLKENRAEVQALFRELLINVTRFFRDPDAFVALKQTILPLLLAGKPEGYVFRVWVAGCASGEEAYSIAMVLLDLMDEIKARHEQEMNIQIYATDLDDEAIAVARVGHYLPNIAQDVTPERLRRFFIRDHGNDGGYKLKKEVRDLAVFAVQNAVKDPPFAKLDLLSCRNRMIYLEPELQNRLIANFHYALKPDGVLFLSASESITSHPDLFSTLDPRWKFYRAKHSGAVTGPGMVEQRVQAAGKGERRAVAAVISRAKAGGAGSVGELSHRALLQTYAPEVKAEDTVGRKNYALGNGQLDIPALRQLLEDVLPREQVMKGYVVEHAFPGLGVRRMVLNARRIVTTAGGTELILLAMVEIVPLESP